ncbi:glycosyltransferase family 39 protein [Ramlibacter tataouinensis]|uniref:ArnT family glycosyltransferase n=1 Tax=Ramlibacter tataouinensis TaxID=94132 RepID=UPI0022F3CC27|nr:glycosyltransferase family 39 protein [Ramlibacter tataouinensis]WBY02962.1 glycosyltransferase family 39 protein [Ramlibacter tataouinensis]
MAESRAGTAPAAPVMGRTLPRLAFAVALALPLLWRLGAPPLFDVDEGAFAEATRELVASGDWLHTTLNGADRFDKPIGIYWLQALAATVFGMGEFAVRLPSALACWGLALALSSFAARRWGETAGAAAGLVAAASVGLQAIGRAATADGVLNLLLVLAALDAWRHVETGAPAPLRRAYAWVGFGLLVKGPIAMLVPGAAFILWCATGRQLALLRRAAGDAVGWALLAAIALPWYAYALQRHGLAFVEGFLVHHNLERFAGPLQGHGGTPLYYLVVLPLMAMPWAPLLVAAGARAREHWRDPLGRYLLGWAAFVFVFFSLSGTKLPHYVLYGYAPLALLMARTLAADSTRLRTVVALGLVAWCVVAAATPWVVLRMAPSIGDPLYRALLAGAPAPAWWPAACAPVLVAALAFCPWPVRDGVARIGAAALALALFCAGWLLPWFGEALQGPVRRAAQVAAGQGGPAVQWRLHRPSFGFYMSRPAPLREPAANDMALTRADRLSPGDEAGRTRLLDERGLVLLGPRTGSAVVPDQKRTAR